MKSRKPIHGEMRIELLSPNALLAATLARVTIAFYCVFFAASLPYLFVAYPKWSLEYLKRGPHATTPSSYPAQKSAPIGRTRTASKRFHPSPRQSSLRLWWARAVP